MSIKLMAQVWKLDLPGREKMVLLRLADHANDEGAQCFPSIRRLAYDTRKSVRSVIYAITALRKLGIVTVPKKGNQYSPNQYVLVLSAGKELPKFEPRSRINAAQATARVASALDIGSRPDEQVQFGGGASAVPDISKCKLDIHNHQEPSRTINKEEYKEHTKPDDFNPLAEFETMPLASSLPNTIPASISSSREGETSPIKIVSKLGTEAVPTNLDEFMVASNMKSLSNADCFPDALLEKKLKKGGWSGIAAGRVLEQRRRAAAVAVERDSPF